MILKTISQFQQDIEYLNEADKMKLNTLMNEVHDRLNFNKTDTKQLLADYEKLIVLYLTNGVKTDEIIRRIDPAKLADFYIQKDINDWYPLDNAAKIYPLAMNHSWMSMFRLSVYLKSDIIPEVLQMALNFTIKRFPYLATTLKKGFFWHYLDGVTSRFRVKIERRLPCSKINVSRNGVAPFRVRYYKNRISIEFFHILTDGSGGMLFLKTLAGEYLRLLGENIPNTEGSFDIGEDSHPAEVQNDFLMADKSLSAGGFTEKQPLHIRGCRTLEQPNQILHFEMDADLLRKTAQSFGTTVTTLMVAVMAYAVKESNKGRKVRPNKPINIQVPVNMRKFYPTKSLRNFSMYCVIRIPAADAEDLKKLIQDVGSQLAFGSSKEELDKTMTMANKLVDSLQYIPLFLKRIGVRIIYGFLGESVLSSTLSNLGVVQTSSEMAEHIDKFDFVLGTPIRSRAVCSMITFNNKAVFSINKATRNSSFEMSILEQIRNLGIPVKLYGSKLI